MLLNRRQRRRLNGDEHSGIASSASSAEHIVSEREKDLLLQIHASRTVKPAQVQALT
jgi:hypothetical protein